MLLTFGESNVPLATFQLLMEVLRVHRLGTVIVAEQEVAVAVIAIRLT